MCLNHTKKWEVSSLFQICACYPRNWDSNSWMQFPPVEITFWNFRVDASLIWKVKCLVVSHLPKCMSVWLEKEDLPLNLLLTLTLLFPTPCRCLRDCHNSYAQGSTWTTTAGCSVAEGKVKTEPQQPVSLAQGCIRAVDHPTATAFTCMVACETCSCLATTDHASASSASYTWGWMRNNLSMVLTLASSKASTLKSWVLFIVTLCSSIALMKPMTFFYAWIPCFTDHLDAPKPVGISIGSYISSCEASAPDCTNTLWSGNYSSQQHFHGGAKSWH